MIKKFIPLFFLLFVSRSFALNSECLLEGHYDLSLRPYGSSQPYWLEGNIGQERIQWNVSPRFSNSVYSVWGWVDSTRVELEMDVRWQPIVIRGWIKNTDINWTGFNGHFFGHQNCIR